MQLARRELRRYDEGGPHVDVPVSSGDLGVSR